MYRCRDNRGLQKWRWQGVRERLEAPATWSLVWLGIMAALLMTRLSPLSPTTSETWHTLHKQPFLSFIIFDFFTATIFTTNLYSPD